MNRLWIRLSLTFAAVMLVATILPLIIFLVLSALGWVGFGPAPVVEQTPSLSDFVFQRLPRQLLLSALFTVVVGVIAGTLASRSLAKPLGELESAARAIGDQDLSYRVALQGGTEEMTAVATAFNEMASKLENAESLRQNLLADVAHELRTPITVVQGSLRAILDDIYPLNTEEIAQLYDQTRHLTRLIDDLHELAQAEAQRLPLNKETVQIAKLVRDATAVFTPIAAEKGVALRVELLGKLPTLEADGARLTQMLQNLVQNALAHTAAGGKVTVQAEQVEEQLVLRVVDSGAGIGAEHINHVFDRFYRTDKARSRDAGGTGLGLAIVRALAEAHGGTAEVTSVGLGQGSTFTVTLPVS